MFNNVKSNLKTILFPPKQVVPKIKVLSLQRLYPYRKPRWAEVGQTYILVMAFLNALVLTNWNLANSSTSQEQSSKERLMRCIISSSYWLQTIFRLLSRGFIYTLTWGFCVARFDLSGNARASIRGTSDRIGSTSFNY